MKWEDCQYKLMDVGTIEDFWSVYNHLGRPIENGVYTVSRRWIYILADVLAMDNLHVGAAPRLFCGFFLK
jgi:hypothetical protein